MFRLPVWESFAQIRCSSHSGGLVVRGGVRLDSPGFFEASVSGPCVVVVCTPCLVLLLPASTFLWCLRPLWNSTDQLFGSASRSLNSNHCREKTLAFQRLNQEKKPQPCLQVLLKNFFVWLWHWFSHYLAPWLFAHFLCLCCITTRLSGSWSRSELTLITFHHRVPTILFLLGYFYCIGKKGHLSCNNKHFQPVKQSSLFEVNKRACLSKGSTISIMLLCTTFVKYCCMMEDFKKKIVLQRYSQFSK